jgi:hypothetical protein
VIFFKFIISVFVITCPENQKKLATPLKKVTLLYYFVYKVIPSLMWKKRRLVYSEQYTRTAIHLCKDITMSVTTVDPTLCIVIVTKLRAGRSEVRIPKGARNFSRLPNVRADRAVRPTFSSVCTGSFLWIKRSRCPLTSNQCRG